VPLDALPALPSAKSSVPTPENSPAAMAFAVMFVVQDMVMLVSVPPTVTGADHSCVFTFPATTWVEPTCV
jgi:hypothetical protein